MAAEWEPRDSIEQSDHGAGGGRALCSGCGRAEPFGLGGLYLQGQQQAGRSNVFCQTQSGDMTTRSKTLGPTMLPYELHPLFHGNVLV